MLVAVRGAIANHKFGYDLSGGPNVLAPDGVDHRLGCHRERTEFASSSCSDHCQVQAYPALQEGVSPEVSLSWFCSWLQLERKGHWITQLLDVCDSNGFALIGVTIKDIGAKSAKEEWTLISHGIWDDKE